MFKMYIPPNPLSHGINHHMLCDETFIANVNVCIPVTYCLKAASLNDVKVNITGEGHWCEYERHSLNMKDTVICIKKKQNGHFLQYQLKCAIWLAKLSPINMQNIFKTLWCFLMLYCSQCNSVNGLGYFTRQPCQR